MSIKYSFTIDFEKGFAIPPKDESFGFLAKFFMKTYTLTICSKNILKSFHMARKYSKPIIEKGYWITSISKIEEDVITLVYEFKFIGLDKEKLDIIKRSSFLTDLVEKIENHKFLLDNVSGFNYKKNGKSSPNKYEKL